MLITRRTATTGILALGAGALGATPALAADDEKALYEAAKKEGTVTWYIGHFNQPIVNSIAEAFAKKYPGIELHGTKTTSQVAFQRLMQDLNAGVVQCDVFSSTDAAHMTRLIKLDKLVKYTPPNAAGMAPAARDFNGGGFYRPGYIGLVAIMYNSKHVSAAESPKDWMDLTDPKWKSKIAFGSPNYSGMVGVWTVSMGEKYGWPFFEKLNKLDPLVGRSIDDAVAMLNSGERVVAICSPASAFRSAAKGNPLVVNYPSSFTVSVMSPSTIIKGSPHPNGAKLFMNFIAGKEYSEILAKNFYPPLRTDVAPPKGAKGLAELTLFEPKLTDLEKDLPGLRSKWRNLFNG